MVEMEGLMIKNYDKQMFGKYVTEKFKEVNKAVFGQSKKYAANDSERLVAIYCTNPRIDKQVFKLIDQGEKLDMTMMTKLPKMVVEDIFEEHWREIGWSNWSINFKEFRSKVAQRCVAILRQLMTNNALNQKK